MKPVAYFDLWWLAKEYMEGKDKPAILSVRGHLYKVYPSGKALCAEFRPFRSFDGKYCNCLADNRKSRGTIARLRIPFPPSEKG